MADGKPARDIARNPFPRKSDFLRRNTRGSRPLRTATKMKSSVAKRPQLVHQFSSPSSLKASHDSTPIHEGNRIDSGYTIDSYYLRPATYDISEVPDTNRHVSDQSRNENGLSSKRSGTHANYRTVKRRYSSPDTPQGHYLPPAVRLSPLPTFKEDGSTSSLSPPLSEGTISPIFDRPPTPNYSFTGPAFVLHKQHDADRAPQNIGWDEFRSSQAPFDVNRHAGPTSLLVPWSKSNKETTQLPPQTKLPEQAPKEKNNTYVHSTSSSEARASRKQSNMETIMRARNFGKKLQVVYHQGPQGEGQKMWNGIRAKRKEKHELRYTQAPLKSLRTMHSPRTQTERSKTQKEQLEDLHAAALDMPAPKVPIASHFPESRPKPTVPARPPPLGIVRSPTIHKPGPESVTVQQRGSARSQGTKVSTASAYTAHSFDVPVAASQSVQYDAQMFVIDESESWAPVPILHAAPKPKATQKRGLPPRPVLAPGEEDPPELAEQERMYRLRVGMSSSGQRVESLPPAPKLWAGSMSQAVAPKSQDNLAATRSHAVGPHFPHAASRSHRLQTTQEDPRTQPLHHTEAKDKDPKNRFAEEVSHFLETSADLWARQKDKARVKHYQKVKHTISAPRPVLAPNGHTANFAASAGGVGGPAAALPVAPKVPNLAIQVSKGKRVSPNPAPPLPPRPENVTLWDQINHVNSHAKDNSNGNGKNKLANWTAPFALARRDSDASMVCADAQEVSRQQKHLQPKRESGTGLLNMMTFRGPVRQHPPSNVRGRDPGSKRQVERYEYSEESLVPEGLEVGKSDVRLHRSYDSLVGQYGGSKVKGADDRKGWF